MSRILVVEDEDRFCEYLCTSLASDGHEVRAACSADASIRLGLRFRPELLVADWMLRDCLSGRHIGLLLSACQPDMATILITGFCADDIAVGSPPGGEVRILEKPFGSAELVEAVRATLEKPESPRDGPSLGLIEVDAGGRILHGSPLARCVLLPAGDHERTGHLSAVGAEAALALKAPGRGVVIHPATEIPSSWQLTLVSTDPEGARLLMLSPAESGDPDVDHFVRTVVDGLTGGSES